MRASDAHDISQTLGVVVLMTCLSRSCRKWSICWQGFLRPVTVLTASPIPRRVPTGSPSRSMPRVVMFSPKCHTKAGIGNRAEQLRVREDLTGHAGILPSTFSAISQHPLMTRWVPSIVPVSEQESPALGDCRWQPGQRRLACPASSVCGWLVP